jgi:hypothetical protein
LRRGLQSFAASRLGRNNGVKREKGDLWLEIAFLQ